MEIWVKMPGMCKPICRALNQESSLFGLSKSRICQQKLLKFKKWVRIRNRPIQIPKELLATFNQAVTSKSFISGNPENGQNVLLIDLDVPIRELFRKLEKNDYTFQQFFLTDAKGIILYPKEEEGSQIFDPKSGAKADSLVSYKSGISIQNINYNQIVYRAYSQRINLDPLQLYFVGIYDDAYFQKVGLRINYNLLSILLFTLVVLIVSLPILTLVNLGKRGYAFSVPNYPSGYLSDGFGSGVRFFSFFYQKPHHPGGCPSSGNPACGKGFWHRNLPL